MAERKLPAEPRNTLEFQITFAEETCTQTQRGIKLRFKKANSDSYSFTRNERFKMKF